LDSYIAIEAISEMAEDEILVDVMLMCNSIKNLIQQNKSEPSLQNALNSNQTNSKANPILKTNRSGSIISAKNKKNTNQDTISLTANLPMTQPVSSQISNLKKADSNLDSNSTNSTSSSPQSNTHNFLKSNDLVKPCNNDIYVSPSAETRTAVKLAANKMQKQQTCGSLSQSENIVLAPPLPTSPLPCADSENEINFAFLSKGMQIILK
jgi:hypothetical protein